MKKTQYLVTSQEGEELYGEQLAVKDGNYLSPTNRHLSGNFVSRFWHRGNRIRHF